MNDIQPSGGKPIRVMIVDDHKAILWGLERLVDSAKPKMEMVGTASNCAEMLATAGAARPDVILLDLDLNGEDSTAAIPELQRQTEAQILILTGDRNPENHQSAIMKGARGVIGKDESAEVLLRAIECVHAGEVWLNRMMIGRVLGAFASGNGTPKKDPEALRIASLTERERAIVRAIVLNRGAKSQTVAESLHISEHTLRNHLTVIYDKLGVRNRLDLFAYATEHGLAED
ncbi:MAG: response regulator transcription factor [Rhodocyclaceae bacterium]